MPRVEYIMYCAVPPPRHDAMVFWLDCGCIGAIDAATYRAVGQGPLLERHVCPVGLRPPLPDPNAYKGICPTGLIIDDVGDWPKEQKALPEGE